MGCLVNPTGVRLGISRLWVSRSWFVKKNYAVFLFRDLLLYNYLFSFFYLLDLDKYLFKYRLADISISRVSTKAFINLFFYKDDWFRTYSYKPFLKFFYSRLRLLEKKKHTKSQLFFSTLLKEKVYRPFFFNELAKKYLVDKAIKEGLESLDLLSMRDRLVLLKKAYKISTAFPSEIEHRDYRVDSGFNLMGLRSVFSSRLLFYDLFPLFSPKSRRKFSPLPIKVSKASFLNRTLRKIEDSKLFGENPKFFDVVKRENKFLYNSLKVLLVLKFGRKQLSRVVRSQKLRFFKGKNIWLLKRKLLRLRAKIFRNRSLLYKTMLNYRDINYSIYGYMRGADVTKFNRRRGPKNLDGIKMDLAVYPSKSPRRRNRSFLKRLGRGSTLNLMDSIFNRKEAGSFPYMILYFKALLGFYKLNEEGRALMSDKKRRKKAQREFSKERKAFRKLNQGRNQNKGFNRNRNQNWDQNKGFNRNQNQNWNQNKNYNRNQNQNWNQNKGFDKNQNQKFDEIGKGKGFKKWDKKQKKSNKDWEQVGNFNGSFKKRS